MTLIRVNNKVEHDVNSMVEGFINYYSTLADILAKMLPKATNKYYINVIKDFEHMI